MVLLIIQISRFKSIFHIFKTAKRIDSCVQCSTNHGRNSIEMSIWCHLLFSFRVRSLGDVFIGNATRKKEIASQNHRTHSITILKIEVVYLEYLHRGEMCNYLVDQKKMLLNIILLFEF